MGDFGQVLLAAEGRPCVKRRAFMGGAAILTMGAASSSKAARAAMGVIDVGGTSEMAALADRLLQAFPQRRSLQVIGDAYRRGRASGSLACRACMPNVLHEFLHHLDLSESDLRRMTPGAIRALIDEGTTRDFSEGRIVGVEGWLLGETEAKLCEVAALRTG